VLSLIDLTVPRTRSSAGAAKTAAEVSKMLAVNDKCDKTRHDVTPFALTDVRMESSALFAGAA
jgi:hypothetical protein